MLSGQGLAPSGDGQRRRHPVTTTIIIVLMMAVLFGGTYGVVRLIRGGGGTPDAAGSSPAPCVTTTVRPGVVLPKPGTITANVYNATNRAGLAKRTSVALAGRGFVIGHVANDPLGTTLKTVAEIRYGPAGLANAQLLAFYVPGAALVADKRVDKTVDLVLGAKFVAIAPQKNVDAALAKPTAVPTGEGCASTSASPTGKPTAKPTAATSAKPSTSPSA